jgi:hypothetical protein
MVSDLVLALVFLAIVAGGVVDLLLDAPREWLSPHVLFELVLIALSLGLALYLWWGWRRTSRTLGEVRTASHKEIAAHTARSERTVRQHAVALYRKAGLAGRAELAAFFLGDLRLPPAPSPGDPRGGQSDEGI